MIATGTNWISTIGSCLTILSSMASLVPWQSSIAGELIRSDVSFHDGVYSIDVAMDIGGNMDKTREILLDYSQAPHYNDNIIKSELMEITDSGTKIGRVEIRDCLLLFCRNLVQIQEMDKLPSGNIRIHVIPEQSDYLTADYLWSFKSRPDGNTRLQINAMIAPRIEVPPLIGPIMIARKLKRRLIEVVKKLEILSRQDNTH